MAPKAKAKGAPAGKAKARVKAKAKAGPKVKAKAKGVPKAGILRRARGMGALRRPAAEVKKAVPAQDTKTAWEGGHTVRGTDVSLDLVMKDQKVVVEEALYFHRPCKLAGLVVGVMMAEGRATLRIQPSGTTDEGLLKLHSANPCQEMRLVLCLSDCNHEEVAEDLVHAVRLRRRRPEKEEEAWVDNLEKVVPTEGHDELERLRKLMGRTGGEVAPGGGAVIEEDKKGEGKRTEKEKKKKEKLKKKEKKKKRRRPSSSHSSGSSTGNSALNGSKPKQASQKSAKGLFQGTGMDPVEKVRNRAARLAKRYIRRKGKQESSSSDGSGESSGAEKVEEEGDSVFQQAAKVRGIAGGYPGVLAYQALAQMKANLMQNLGEEEKNSSTQAVAVMYFRQVLQKKATGAVSRELLSLCAVADQLVRARPAQALDVVMQRLKSAESTLSGTHWSVSQRLEILPPEQTTLTAMGEMKEAQKVAMDESKVRWMASQPDGRVPTGQKGGAKGKGAEKGDQRKGGDGRKGGKSPGAKGDWKKKEDAGGKAS